MPRIVPIQLLKCLKVLLDDNGGILSAGEVKRLASLMTKYSKKLVSKCIYVQILKCTKTELLGEFMGAGGWSLVYTWLNDAIRAMNWPLVQEILELLLLCPVDVNRLKINSAPKLVKGLCKDGGNEGVRILAKRLVEQWLKVVTENPEATLANSAASAAISTATTAAMTPQASAVIKTPPVAVVAPIVTPASIQQTAAISTTTAMVSPVQSQQISAQNQKSHTMGPAAADAIKAASKATQELEDEEDEQEDAEEECQEEEEQDPLGGVQETTTAAPSSYGLTPAQKKASESGLVYKIVVKNGNQFLAKVPKAPMGQSTAVAKSKEDEDEEEEMESEDVIEEGEAADVADEDTDVVDNASAAAVADADDNCSSIEKSEKENDSNSGNEEDLKSKSKPEDVKKTADKKSSAEDKEKTNTTTSTKERRSSKEKERRSSSNGLEKEKDKDKEKEKEKEKDRDSKSSKSSSSSSSSSHRSSSHKSSSSTSKSSSSSSSKSKSSSSSSHRSSNSGDKHKSDKEREKERSSSSSSKDKDRSSSSGSSSKHRSSSSKSSSSSSSSSKDKYREKDKNTSTSSSSSSSSKNKDNKERDTTTSSQSDKDKSSSSSSLPKIPKKPKEENDADSANKPTSITIPSKKASMSIEIRKDTEKSKTVKTYKSQFRSHGLTEEAPPPPSRKGLKKPSQPSVGAILPTSLPSSLKRSSPPPRDSPTEKKAKIDINNVTVANEKPGAIKLIPPKKIQTLVETNLFSDALSAATGPKKVNKRKRSTTPAPTGGKDGAASPPTSPAAESPKVMPLKFYQDTLDESKSEDSKSDKENEDIAPNKSTPNDEDPKTTDKDNDNDDDDDDIPLKKVKEDIEQKVALEKKMDVDANVIDITKEVDNKEESVNMEAPSSPNEETAATDMSNDVPEVKKPGPGCGPNGPPGVLMLHRRKGPKKKLTWRPQETLEQVRFFELDENERCNVTKTSFMDMKNLERFNERDAIVLARRGFNQEDNMEPTTSWKTLIEVDEVPPHPEGNQSKQRKIQAEREMTTLRALYFTHALIPDSPAEAEIEPIFNHDTPLIPLDDLTGNPDAVNDFTSMPWPEPRGSPKHGDSCMAGTGGLGSPVDIFGAGGQPQMMPVPGANNNGGGGGGGGGVPGGNPFNPFVNSFPGNQSGPNGPTGPPMQNGPQGNWQRPPNGMSGNGPMMGNPFVNNHGSPIMDMMGGPRSGGGGPGPGHMMNNGPPQNFNNQNFNNQFSPNNNQFSPNNNPFGPPMNGPPMNGPPMGPFGGGPPGNNFGSMGPGGPMVPPHMMNGMGPGPMMGNNGPPMMNGPNNNRNNGGNWRSGGPNFQDNNGGGGGNWRPAGTGPNNRGGNGGGGGGNGNNNNGICKAFMRGHCRLGKACKYIHPSKGKRI